MPFSFWSPSHCLQGCKTYFSKSYWINESINCIISTSRWKKDSCYFHKKSTTIYLLSHCLISLVYPILNPESCQILQNVLILPTSSLPTSELKFSPLATWTSFLYWIPEFMRQDSPCTKVLNKTSFLLSPFQKPSSSYLGNWISLNFFVLKVRVIFSPKYDRLFFFYPFINN